tara:strand:- start:28 stop:183 length:156 start_codon:yes stop_codon:yes gene_type:complete
MLVMILPIAGMVLVMEMKHVELVLVIVVFVILAHFVEMDYVWEMRLVQVAK